MAFLTSGLGEERVKWQGGKSGDVNADGVPYGTLVSDVPAIQARLAAEHAQVAAATMPWANLFGGDAENPLGLSTTSLAGIAALAIVGIALWKKYRK